MDESQSGWVEASVTSNDSEPSVRGNLDASPSAAHELLLNARVVGTPEDLRLSVEAQVAALPGMVKIQSLRCFSPSAPKPERRLDYVVTDDSVL
jgi:hypothetical protein